MTCCASGWFEFRDSGLEVRDLKERDEVLRAAQDKVLEGIDPNVRERASKIRLAAFDIDGTLTDGCLRFAADGHEFKVFNAHDGFGLKRLQAHGIEVALISARISHAVAIRAEELDITHVYQGQDDKRECLAHVMSALKLDPEQAAFTGDDLPDLPALRSAGLAIAVANAHPALDAWVHWRTPQPGGHGAARNVCDLLLAAQGAYADDLGRWL